MRAPLFNNNEFLDETSFNNAYGLVTDSLVDITGNLHTPGLINASALSFSYSGLTITIDAPLPFRALFSDGTLASANGTVDGESSSSATVDFSSLVPSTGSVTAYLVAVSGSVLQQPSVQPGPPVGHPDYSPSFAPYTAYSETQDTLIFSATTTAPDNTDTLLICSTVLSAGQTTITTSSTSGQVRAGAILSQDGEVLAADLASGAAASNVGTLGGSLVGTLPNPTLAATGAASGTYINPVTITVDEDGRISDIANVDDYDIPGNLTVGGDTVVDGTVSGASAQINGNATVTGTASAAAGTSGNQVINYTQMTNGSLSPKFSFLQRQTSQTNQNWLPNSSFLYGFAGWENPAGLTVGDDNDFTYATYNGTDTSTQYLTSTNLTAAQIINSGDSVNLSGWIYNGTASASATLALNCYNSSGSLISTIASSSVSIGNGWTYITNSGTIPANTSYVKVALGFAGASSNTNLAFSQIKLENGNTATPWDDESSAEIFQNGSFSPTFGETVVAPATQNNAAVQLGQLTDGSLSPSFGQTIVAPAAASNEAVQLGQLTNGSLSPSFGQTIVAPAAASNEAVQLAQLSAGQQAYTAVTNPEPSQTYTAHGVFTAPCAGIVSLIGICTQPGGAGFTISSTINGKSVGDILSYYAGASYYGATPVTNGQAVPWTINVTTSSASSQEVLNISGQLLFTPTGA